MMPHYDEYMKMRGKVRDIYQHSFYLADVHIPTKYIFEQAHVYIVHFFKNRIIRDLDNRYTKFIIDNLRFSGYVPDDNWQHIWWTEIGLFGEEEKVQMYVVEADKSPDFYSDHIMKLRADSLNISKNREDEEAVSLEEHRLNLDLGMTKVTPDHDTTPKKRNPKMDESLF